MDLDQVIAELREELERVKHIIGALESLQQILHRRQDSEAALEAELNLRKPARRKKPESIDRVSAAEEGSR